jgi:hypothetical protein
MNVLPLIGGGIFGAMLKLWANAQQAKADQHKRTMEALTKQHEQVNVVNKHAEENKGFAWTRRFIVVAVTSVIIGAFWYSGAITIPTEVTEGGSYLWGLIDTTEIVTEYKTIDTGKVVLPVLIPSFQAIIGTYMGSSIVGGIKR